MILVEPTGNRVCRHRRGATKVIKPGISPPLHFQSRRRDQQKTGKSLWTQFRRLSQSAALPLHLLIVDEELTEEVSPLIF